MGCEDVQWLLCLRPWCDLWVRRQSKRSARWRKRRSVRGGCCTGSRARGKSEIEDNLQCLELLFALWSLRPLVVVARGLRPLRGCIVCTEQGDWTRTLRRTNLVKRLRENSFRRCFSLTESQSNNAAGLQVCCDEGWVKMADRTGRTGVADDGGSVQRRPYGCYVIECAELF